MKKLLEKWRNSVSIMSSRQREMVLIWAPCTAFNLILIALLGVFPNYGEFFYDFQWIGILAVAIMMTPGTMVFFHEIASLFSSLKKKISRALHTEGNFIVLGDVNAFNASYSKKRGGGGNAAQKGRKK